MPAPGMTPAFSRSSASAAGFSSGGGSRSGTYSPQPHMLPSRGSSSPVPEDAAATADRVGREGSIQALVDKWYDAEYVPNVLHTLTRYFSATSGIDAAAAERGEAEERQWVRDRTDRHRFPLDLQEGAASKKGSRAVAVLLPRLPEPAPTLPEPPPALPDLEVVRVVLEQDPLSPEEAKKAEQAAREARLDEEQAAREARLEALEEQTRPAPYLTLQRLRVLYARVPLQPQRAGAATEHLTLARTPPFIPATALLTSVWLKLFGDCTRGLDELAPPLAPALTALQSAADAAARRYEAAREVVDAEDRLVLVQAALARAGLSMPPAPPPAGAARGGVGGAAAAAAPAPAPAAGEAKKLSSREAKLAEAREALEKLRLAREESARCSAEGLVEARIAFAARAVQAYLAGRLEAPKVLLRPLLALAATFESNPSEPFGALKRTRALEDEVREWNVCVLFCSAFVPPGKAQLEAFKPHFHGKWCEMLSRQHGLWSYLRYGSLETTTQPHTAMAQQPQRARVAFLQAMEMQHQMFARCSLPELGELQTTSQTFKATVEVETITLFPNDAFWTWRDLLPEQKRRPELSPTEQKAEFELEESEHVRDLLPRNWNVKHDVHSAKHYESSPCNWAIRTKFNRQVIGEDSKHDSVTTSMVLSKEATGHLGGAAGVLAFQGIEPGLFLSRLVPEAAGDPWTPEGRAAIFDKYTQVRSVQTFSSTFDCLLKLENFPADQQQVVIDISSEFLFFFSRLLHHQNVAFDGPTSVRCSTAWLPPRPHAPHTFLIHTHTHTHARTHPRGAPRPFTPGTPWALSSLTAPCLSPCPRCPSAGSCTRRTGACASWT